MIPTSPDQAGPARAAVPPPVPAQSAPPDGPAGQPVPSAGQPVSSAGQPVSSAGQPVSSAGQPVSARARVAGPPSPLAAGAFGRPVPPRAGERAGERTGDRPGPVDVPTGPSEAGGVYGDGWPVRRGRVIVAGITAVVLVAGAGVAAYATAGEVPRGTQVLGVDIGGKSRAEAEAALSGGLAATVATPARVSLDGREAFELAPASIGLGIDVSATVDTAVQGGARLFGHRDVPPAVRIDPDRLEAALRKRLSKADVTVKKAGIAYRGLVPVPTYPQPGRDLDPARAADLVKTAWPAGRVAEVPLAERPPATSREQLDALVASVAAPAVAAPVTVVAGTKTFTLTPAAIAKGLVFRADGAGLLTPRIDAKKLRAAAATELAKAEVEAREATVALAGGKPKVVASSPGETVDMTRLSADLLAVLPQPGPRRITATLKKQEAATTDADVSALGIKERVSTFTTRFPGGLSSPRSQNIITIAKEVDGAVVKPGAVFSLNGHTGIRSYPQGYKDAPVIIGGKLEPGVGGGASQFTTTLFNAAYYAGLEDIEHKPHSFYFSRYPAVIESTIFYPTLDLKFRNNTPYGILIDTSHTARTVTVSMWSTRYYDSVRTVRSPRRNITSPPTTYRDPGPKCIATSGLPGFTQDAFRVIRKDGKEVKREKFTWRYDPEPRFICGKKPS